MRYTSLLSLVTIALTTTAGSAGTITKTFSGTVAVADPIFGSVGVGSTFNGSFTYENDPTLNPGFGGGAFNWISFAIDGNAFAHNIGTGLGRQQDIFLANDIPGVVRDQIQVEGLFQGIVYTLSIRGSSTAFSDTSAISVLDPVTGANFSPSPPGLTVGPIRLDGGAPAPLNSGPTFVFAGQPITLAVPEPSSLTLASLGLIGTLGFSRWIGRKVK